MKFRIVSLMLAMIFLAPAFCFGAVATVASGTVDLSSGALSVSVAPGVMFEFYGASVFSISNADGARAATSETVYIYIVLATGAKYKTDLYRGALSSEYSVTFIPDAGPMVLPSTATVYVTSTNGGGTNHATGITFCFLKW